MPTKPGVKASVIKPSGIKASVIKASGVLKYEPRFCDEIMEFMGRGYSLTAFAGEIGASRATLLKWCEKHPLFAEAVACAQARRARVLEDRLLAASGAAAFGAHMQALKTAAPDEWAGRSSTGGSSTGGASTRAAADRHPGRGRPSAEASLDIPDNGRDPDDVH